MFADGTSNQTRNSRRMSTCPDKRGSSTVRKPEPQVILFHIRFTTNQGASQKQECNAYHCHVLTELRKKRASGVNSFVRRAETTPDTPRVGCTPTDLTAHAMLESIGPRVIFVFARLDERGKCEICMLPDGLMRDASAGQTDLINSCHVAPSTSMSGYSELSSLRTVTQCEIGWCWSPHASMVQ